MLWVLNSHILSNFCIIFKLCSSFRGNMCFTSQFSLKALGVLSPFVLFAFINTVLYPFSSRTKWPLENYPTIVLCYPVCHFVWLDVDNNLFFWRWPAMLSSLSFSVTRCRYQFARWLIFFREYFPATQCVMRVLGACHRLQTLLTVVDKNLVFKGRRVRWQGPLSIAFWTLCHWPLGFSQLSKTKKEFHLRNVLMR